MNWAHPIRAIRRLRAAGRPFPAEWEQHLARYAPFDARLPEADRAELRRRIRIFLAEKRFEGVGGLRLTDAIRVAIAAGACLLLLRRGEDYYPDLASILVYPAAYRVHARVHSADGLVTEGDEVRTGEAWVAGTVVVSWQDVVRGIERPGDGHNVIVHEFAHQLDMEDRDANGAPLLDGHAHYAEWARVLGREFERLQASVERHQPTFVNPYGAQSPAEFFAVVSEAFFETPALLRGESPELYAQLRRFYRQDPATWPGSAADQDRPRAPSTSR